jgi:Bacterial SH3 domain.
MQKKLIALILILTTLAALCIPAAQASGVIMYVYTENGGKLNVRRDPLVANNVIAQIPYGQAVSVRITMANGWACIDWAGADTSVAYVQSRYLSWTVPTYHPVTPTPAPVPAPTAAPSGNTGLAAINAEFRTARQVSPYIVIARPSRASGWVNLRWAPSVDAERIATCPQGKELTVLAEMQNWYQVQDPVTGMIGFIMRQYVQRR